MSLNFKRIAIKTGDSAIGHSPFGGKSATYTRKERRDESITKKRDESITKKHAESITKKRAESITKKRAESITKKPRRIGKKRIANPGDGHYNMVCLLKLYTRGGHGADAIRPFPAKLGV